MEYHGGMAIVGYLWYIWFTVESHDNVVEIPGGGVVDHVKH
jgi:hypothetical protein